MVDMILENYSKAVDSALKMQQEMLRNWTMPWSACGTRVPELPLTGTSTAATATTAAAWLEPFRAVQAKWAEAVIDMLKRNRETLDEQYRAGIRIINDAFRIGEARDPEQFLCLSQELSRQNFEVLKTAIASQMHDIQCVTQKCYEAARLGVVGPKS